jgi:GntR family transcriptional regulator, transcriptional repressor for pyruvate dehydrogenase complex
LTEGSSAITDAVFRPVRTGNAFEETMERLLDGIKLGVHANGDRLPSERELASRLGVSRVTVRDALRELASAGYVETKRGRFGGTFVISQPPPVLLDMPGVAALADELTFRRAVENGAAEAAARASLSQAQREQLAASLATVVQAAPDAYRQADSLFHLTIAEATGSPLLAGSVVDARLRIVDLLNSIPMLEVNLAHANAQHQRIADAILTGDPVAAREAMDEHCEGTAALLRGFLGAKGS